MESYVESGSSFITRLFELVDENTVMGRIFSPEKYAEPIQLYKLVASPVVSQEGVERYYGQFERGEMGVQPFLVVRKRNMDVYAVWNGMHRYWAMMKFASEANSHSDYSIYNWDVPCAVVESKYDVLFYMVKDGHFQAGPHFTRYVRPVLKKLAEERLEGELRERMKRFV